MARISKKRLDGEVRTALRNAGLRAQAQSCVVGLWSDEDEAEASERDYAWVLLEDQVEFGFSRKILVLDDDHRRAIVAHEVGHVLAWTHYGDDSEDGADQAAEQFLGVPICYDHDWPGKGLQVDCRIENPRRNPSFVLPPDELLSASIYREPLYHGSSKRHGQGHTLRPDRGSEYGIYLSPRRRYAAQYGEHVSEVYASVRRPLVVEGKYEVSPRDLTRTDIERLQRQGYDSIVVTSSTPEHASEVVLFDAEQAWVAASENPKRGRAMKNPSAPPTKLPRNRFYGPEKWVVVQSSELRPGMIVAAPKWIKAEVDDVYASDRSRSYGRSYKEAKIPFDDYWGGDSPDFLYVETWDWQEGESKLHGLDMRTRSRTASYVDANTNDYPALWYVAASSIDAENPKQLPEWETRGARRAACERRSFESMTRNWDSGDWEMFRYYQEAGYSSEEAYHLVDRDRTYAKEGGEKSVNSGPRNPYQGDAVELAKYRKARERWEREGRRGPPPMKPRSRNPKKSNPQKTYDYVILQNEVQVAEGSMKSRSASDVAYAAWNKNVPGSLKGIDWSGQMLHGRGAGPVAEYEIQVRPRQSTSRRRNLRQANPAPAVATRATMMARRLANP